MSERVPSSIYIFLVLGLIAASQSGNIIRLANANPIAIATWRLVIASLVLAPLAGKRLRVLLELSSREWCLLVFAGFALAFHFFAWITAVQWTSVANAAIFFGINPVITSIAAHLLFGEKIGLRLILSICLGVFGIVVVGYQDLDLSTASLAGDGMALLCSVLFTAYFLAGKQLRKKLDNRVYVTGIYSVAALVSFVCLLALDLPVLEYDSSSWLCFVLMAFVPTLIGHTSFNSALRYIDASRISIATLSEPVLAALVASWAWGESLTWFTAVGYGIICCSVLLLLIGKR